MTYSIRLPKQIEIRLSRLAKLTHRTKSFYVKTAICEFMDDLEDIYESEKILEDVKAGRTKTISLKDVMEKYGMAN